MFRIDRRYVKLTAPKVNTNRQKTDEKDEVGAQEETTDAAALATAAEDAAMDLAKMYLSEAERELEEQRQAIIDEAHEQAAKIAEDAKKEAKKEKKRAYDEGYAEGKEEGKHAYDEALEQQLAEGETALRNVLDEVARERERVNSEMEEDTVALAVEVVRKIFAPAEEELGNVFISLIKNALRQMSTDNKFTIRVSPGEYERYFATGAGRFELESGTVVTATVLRDVGLEEGDLIIDTEDVTINAGLDSQLKYVSLAFERANQYEPE